MTAEGGSKKEYKDFIEVIESHVAINWEDGNHIRELIRDSKEPVLPIPEDIFAEDQKSRLKLRIWEINLKFKVFVIGRVN